MYVSYRRPGTLMSVFILHNYCSSTGTCRPYKSCYIIFLYHCMSFLYMVYSHCWLWQLPLTALYVDIFITDYYVIHIYNLEQFENKVTYLLTHSLIHSLTHLYLLAQTMGLFSVRRLYFVIMHVNALRFYIIEVKGLLYNIEQCQIELLINCVRLGFERT